MTRIYHTDRLPGRTVQLTDGSEFLWFSGTDYLGMGHNEALRRHVLSGTETFGSHYGSSRNNSLRLSIYDEAERQLADYLHSEAVLLVSSGMWAGQLVMKEIENIVRQPIYHYAPGVHPALWGNAFEKTEGTWDEWALRTVATINASTPDATHIICTDAIGSPMVRAFDFPLFNAIESKPNVWLLIDESHSLGVLTGNGAAGSIDPLLLKQIIFVSSLNKAMGIPAGAIRGAADALDTLRKSPWFAGASPPAPAYVHAFRALLMDGTYEAARLALLENIARFNAQLNGLALFETVQNYPVYCSLNAALFEHLLQNGIMASCFPYPSPADAPVTRIAISSLHQPKDLDRLAEVCKQFIT